MILLLLLVFLCPFHGIFVALLRSLLCGYVSRCVDRLEFRGSLGEDCEVEVFVTRGDGDNKIVDVVVF